mmetsp:Transcript_85059/g.266092  ORF Transcript_85059/g.266092 Transcript_85059/m.266092 type:complete len:87 (+) Transcript_85059:200-460(+)
MLEPDVSRKSVAPAEAMLQPDIASESIARTEVSMQRVAWKEAPGQGLADEGLSHQRSGQKSFACEGAVQASPCGAAADGTISKWAD